MRCENCDECVYIGEGDFACMKSIPKIILTDFSEPTSDYKWCKKRRRKKQHAN